MILTTPRLTLVACSLEVAQTLLGDRPGAQRVLGATLPTDWPSPELKEIVPLYVQELLHDPTTLGWGIWVSVDHEASVVVGSAGFKGRPDAFGTVETGYGTAPAYRGRGYATEAVRAIIDWAFTHPEVERVIAECAPDNTASISVLAKAGFRLLTSTPPALKWERTSSSGVSGPAP